MNDSKVCSKCKRVLPLEMFWKDKTNSTGYCGWCKECKGQYIYSRRGRSLQLRQINRRSKQEVLTEAKTPCLKCGETRWYLIQYHHVDPATKAIKHSMRNYSLEQIENEIEKCVCLCANCHIEFHHLYGQNPVEPKRCLEEYLGTRYKD